MSKRGLNKDEVIEAIALKPSDMSWEELARRLKTTHQNVTYYRRRYAEEVLQTARQELAACVPGTYQALAAKAKQGDVAAAKLILEHLGMMEAKAPERVDHEEVLRIIAEYTATNERVREMVRVVKEQKRQKQEQRASSVLPEQGGE